MTLDGKPVNLGTVYYCCSEATFDPDSIVVADHGTPSALADPSQDAVMWAQWEAPTEEEFERRVTEFQSQQ